MTTPEQKIKGRAREDAKIIANSILNMEASTGAPYAEAFLDELRDLLPCKKADEPKPPAEPEPIARIGKREMWYVDGLAALDDIPMGWLKNQLMYRELSAKDLSDYLNHPEIDARRGIE